jgi:arsenical pump membrane protein
MPTSPSEGADGPSVGRWGWVLCAVGLIGAAIAVFAAPHEARGAAAQTWSPFVLVSGLLLVGLVAEDDGLFRAAGRKLSDVAPRGPALLVGSTLLVVLVTATLNLDTSVVFVTPVLIATASQRGGGERPLLYGSLLLANASSLFLPGSNLTNLIVLGQLHLSGGAFLALMWPAALAAVVATAMCILVWGRRDLMVTASSGAPVERPVIGLGLGAIALVTVLVLVLGTPALPVLIVGIVVSVIRIAQRRIEVRRAVQVLGAPVLVGLFGVTVALGALGRGWNSPAHLLAHADSVVTALTAGAASVLVNNLPAASLLAARPPRHAAELLVGLNLGPNLFVTGSLAWFLWFRVARASGARPSIGQASRLGLVVVPVSMALALAALAVNGSG